jgi:phage regulatory protein, rha family|nr:MAG TPA: regulatory protein [Caudoviricetes sp.]
MMLVEIKGKKSEERLLTTSKIVAEVFEKRHDHVLRDIEELKLNLPNFGEMYIEDIYLDSKGRKQKMHLINRDGFSLLVMGYTGEKALKFKLDFIKAFNAMEQELKRIYDERQQWLIEREKGKLVRHILTDTIKMKVAESPHKKFMYPNYTRLIYKQLFGKSFKELQEQYGIKGKESLRDYLTSEELKELEDMEMLISSLIGLGWGYERIKDFIIIEKTKKLAI